MNVSRILLCVLVLSGMRLMPAAETLAFGGRIIVTEKAELLKLKDVFTVAVEPPQVFTDGTEDPKEIEMFSICVTVQEHSTHDAIFVSIGEEHQGLELSLQVKSDHYEIGSVAVLRSDIGISESLAAHCTIHVSSHVVIPGEDGSKLIIGTQYRINALDVLKWYGSSTANHVGSP